MKNAIQYYYSMNPRDIHQVNKKYKFNIYNKEYILCQYERNLDELQEIYELHIYINSVGMYCHKIIPNNNNQIITIINGIKYILLQSNIENRKIDTKDIMNLSNIKIDQIKLKKIKRTLWKKLWSDKIDYIEYQISQFGKKYKKIRESSDYYIGIVENCISLLSDIDERNIQMGISHNRTYKDSTTEDFYNPTNFIIDSRVRDICEFFKSYIQNEVDIIQELKKYIYINKLNNYEIKQLFIRILYPSIYIDKCELILNNRINENQLDEIIKKTEITEKYLKKIYNYIKNITYLPEIEWLKKM